MINDKTITFKRPVYETSHVQTGEIPFLRAEPTSKLRLWLFCLLVLFGFFSKKMEIDTHKRTHIMHTYETMIIQTGFPTNTALKAQCDLRKAVQISM